MTKLDKKELIRIGMNGNPKILYKKLTAMIDKVETREQFYTAYEAYEVAGPWLDFEDSCKVLKRLEAMQDEEEY